MGLTNHASCLLTLSSEIDIWFINNTDEVATNVTGRYRACHHVYSVYSSTHIRASSLHPVWPWLPPRASALRGRTSCSQSCHKTPSPTESSALLGPRWWRRSDGGRTCTRSRKVLPLVIPLSLMPMLYINIIGGIRPIDRILACMIIVSSISIISCIVRLNFDLFSFVSERSLCSLNTS